MTSCFKTILILGTRFLRPRMVHFSGLEDQLLGTVVAEERPDLEEAKNQLIVSNAKMKQELKEIEDKILHRLSTSEGSPVDDIDLINTLEASQIKSQEIKVTIHWHSHFVGVHGKPCIYMDCFCKANLITETPYIFGKVKNTIHTFIKASLTNCSIYCI